MSPSNQSHSRLASGLRQELAPNVFQRELLLETLRRKIYFRDQKELAEGPETTPRGQGRSRWSIIPQPPTDEDVRTHAWLAERLAVLHYERNGLGPRLRRFLLDNCLVRWLGGLVNKVG
jgi:hypothetical protein